MGYVKPIAGIVFGGKRDVAGGEVAPPSRPAPPPPDASTAGFPPADGFNAARLLLAVIDEDTAEAEQVLADSDLLPLLSGLCGLAISIGEYATGDIGKLRRAIDRLMLSPVLDAADTADVYRARRAS